MAVTPVQTDATPVSAFPRLLRVRARQRLVRTALWVWCAVCLLWLLPLGGWSAGSLSPVWSSLVGACLIAGGVLLWLLHGMAERREPPRSAVRLHGWDRATGGPGSRRRWGTDVAVLVCATGALLAAPALAIRSVPGVSTEALWLLVPLGGMALAARWGMRGALAGAVIGLSLFMLTERGRLGELDRSLMVATLLLIVAVPVAVALLGGGRRIGVGERLTDERLRAAEARALVQAGETRFGALRRDAAEVTTVLRADGSRCYVSPSVELVLGYPPARLIGSGIWSDVHPDDVTALLDTYLACLTGPRRPHRLEYRCKDSIGRWRYLDAVFTNLLNEAEIGGVVVSFRDVTERRHYEERLAYQAHHDALTGLPNRGRFLELLGAALRRPNQWGEPLAVLFLDLDGFKSVNDTLGHGTGDALLVRVAQRLLRGVRPGDTVARLGGDEFTVLLAQIRDGDDAHQIAGRLIAALDEPFAIDGGRITTSASIGIALGTAGLGTESSSELLRRADIALYRAKDAGKGRAVLFTPSMDPTNGDRGSGRKPDPRSPELRSPFQRS